MKDPMTQWEGGFPYDLLTRAGVTPDSSQAEVQRASFALLSSGGMSTAEREAWNQLRILERRVIVDLFLHPRGLPAPSGPPPAPLAAYAFGPPPVPLGLFMMETDS